MRKIRMFLCRYNHNFLPKLPRYPENRGKLLAHWKMDIFFDRLFSVRGKFFQVKRMTQWKVTFWPFHRYVYDLSYWTHGKVLCLRTFHNWYVIYHFPHPRRHAVFMYSVVEASAIVRVHMDAFCCFVCQQSIILILNNWVSYFFTINWLVKWKKWKKSY